MTHEDGFELADPAPAVLVDAGKKCSFSQLRLINKRIEKMDELGVRLPAKFGHRVYGEYTELSYLKADELIQTLGSLMQPAKNKKAADARNNVRLKSYVEINGYSRYMFDPLTFKVIRANTGKPLRPRVKDSGVVEYTMYRDDYDVIVSTEHVFDEEVGRRMPKHTYKTVKSQRKSLSVATLYRLATGWTTEELDIEREIP